MAMARNVLTSDTASAPASSAALAIELMSVTFGVSFGITGSRRRRAHGPDHVGRSVETAAEGDAAFLDVGARDVELECRNAFDVGQDLRQLHVLLQRGPADVDDDHGAARAQLRHFLFDEAVHADALQPDRVEHARRRFDDTRRRVAFALGKKESLDGDAAERRQIDEVGVLRAVAEAAAGGDERVFERQRARCGRRDSTT